MSDPAEKQEPHDISGWEPDWDWLAKRYVTPESFVSLVVGLARAAKIEGRGPQTFFERDEKKLLWCIVKMHQDREKEHAEWARSNGWAPPNAMESP